MYSHLHLFLLLHCTTSSILHLSPNLVPFPDAREHAVVYESRVLTSVRSSNTKTEVADHFSHFYYRTIKKHTKKQQNKFIFQVQKCGVKGLEENYCILVNEALFVLLRICSHPCSALLLQNQLVSQVLLIYNFHVKHIQYF